MESRNEFVDRSIFFLRKFQVSKVLLSIDQLISSKEFVSKREESDRRCNVSREIQLTVDNDANLSQNWDNELF